MKTKIIKDDIPCYHGRGGKVELKLAKCHITGEETICISMDSSEGEYGYINVSLKFIKTLIDELSN